MPDVVLVSMPFAAAFWPSLGLSLLKAQLTRHGIASRVRYFSLDFAELTGQAFYSGVATEARPSNRELAGEWIFAGELFDRTDHQRHYVRDILRKRGAWTTRERVRAATPALIRRIRLARRRAPAFLDRCLESVLRDNPKIVGFTSVFQQHGASLALARRLKRVRPDIFIMMGGSNCEGVMGAETVRQFPFVDAAVSGEADLIFPELVCRILAAAPIDDIPGVRTRNRIDADFAAGRFDNGPSVRNMDDLPCPDYSDYFEQFEATRFSREWQPGIFFETSRGCWWGERHHCTFCGLNGSTMTYRSKSARHAIGELETLIARHPGSDVQIVDAILDMRYFKDFLPELAAKRLGVELFYETKSNLKKEQLRLLRDAGVRRIQPGIESFSDQVLRLMRKGVSGLQNVQLLKWCKELGVIPNWNVLWGFPGEDPQEYKKMAALVPRLTHLQPPNACLGIRLDRFSPNFFDADRLGLTDVRPLAPYRYLYPFDERILHNLAYYFSFSYREPQDVDQYVARLTDEVRVWKRAAGRYDLFFVDLEELLLVWDTRPPVRRQHRPFAVLNGVDRLLYLACDTTTDLGRLAEVAQAAGATLTAEQVERRLDPLVARDLLVREGNKYLALAVRLGEYVLTPESTARFFEIAKAIGRRRNGHITIALDDSPNVVPAFRLARLLKAGTTTYRRARLHRSQFSLNDRGELVVSTRASQERIE